MIKNLVNIAYFEITNSPPSTARRCLHQTLNLLISVGKIVIQSS